MKRIILAVAVFAALHDGQAGMIAFRNDTTGVFPSDCRPPTEFDGVDGKNLAWKVNLPNYGNSSPIGVDGKVFVTCAAGWPAGQDCAVLLCYDAATGKELWRRDLDEFDGMPAEQAKEAREVRKVYYERIRKGNELRYEWKSAAEPRQAEIAAEFAKLGIAASKLTANDSSWGAGTVEVALFNDREFGAKLKNVCGYAPITWAPTCLDMVMPTPVSDGKRVFVYNGRRAVHAFDLDGQPLWNVWQGDAVYVYHYPEDLACSPMIVGDLLLMYAFDHLWAYELDTGKLRWKTESKVPYRHGMGQSLRLNLPMAKGGSEPVFYLWTGDLVRVRDGKVLCRDAAPLAAGSLSSDGVDRVFLGIIGSGNVEAKGTNRQWQFTSGGSQGGGLGVRFLLTGDTATAEKLWFNSKNAGYKALDDYPLFHQGWLWLQSGTVVDPATGKAVATHKVPSTKGIGTHGFILAGGHFYGVQDDRINEGSGGASGLGKQQERVLLATVAKLGADRIEKSWSCPIEVLPATFTEPAKRAQVIALTGLDRHRRFYGWSAGYGTPFAAGNRLFIRTFNTLYCFEAK